MSDIPYHSGVPKEFALPTELQKAEFSALTIVMPVAQCNLLATCDVSP